MLNSKDDSGPVADCKLYMADMEAKIRDLSQENLICLLRQTCADYFSLQQRLVETIDKTACLEQMLHLAGEYSGGGIWAFDVNHHFQYLTVSCRRLLGYSEIEMKRLHPEDLLTAEGLQTIRNHMNQMLESDDRKTAVPIRRLELEHRRKDGVYVWMEVGITPQRDASGRVCGMLGITRDITEQRQREKERALLFTAIEQTAEAVLVTDRDGRIRYVNPAFERITGYHRSEVIGSTPRMLKSGHNAVSLYESLWRTIRGGAVWTGQFMNKRKDHSLYEEAATISPVYDGLGHIVYFVKVARDISHTLELERQLRQTQKMDALGRLAGGVAHDFNNILTASIGFLELALQATEAQNEVQAHLHQVMAGLERAEGLVRQILTFSRQSERDRKPMLLRPALEETLQLLRGSLPSTIEIRTHITTEDCLVYADTTEIHQIIMNLCTNAYHAMTKTGGVMEVSLRKASHHSRTLPKKIIQYAVITVSDTGHGMNRSTLERIFDPYFTTKQPGEGTGLGLSTVHGIVSSYGGSVQASSTPGQGSLFEVRLPILTAEKDPPQVKPPAKSFQGRNEKVLFVDDEEIICRLMQTCLNRLGFRVDAHAYPESAIAAFLAAPADYDIVVTDCTMPQITGLELARQLHVLRPDLPIILCSGFMEVFHSAHLQSLGIRACLQKPMRGVTLATTLRTVLDHPVDDKP